MPQSEAKSPAELVARMDAYYQAQFADLEKTKEGIFGTGRVESSEINGHARDGGDGAYGSVVWYNAVAIYGCQGKPLDPKTIARRYHRFANGEADIDPKTMGALLGDEDFSKAITRFASGSAKPLVIRKKRAYVEIRPVRLSRSECLGCHDGMKLQDPVALMVYTVAPKKRASRAP